MIGGRETATGDLYGIWTFDWKGYDFFVTCSKQRSSLDGPFFTLRQAVDVLVERCVYDGIIIEEWIEDRCIADENGLISFPQEWIPEAKKLAMELNEAGELKARQRDRDTLRFLQLDEAIQEALIDQDEETAELIESHGFPFVNARVLVDWHRQ
jgi:hypothetical protein